MELIAVILAAPSSKERFADAAKLLDFGFANFATFKVSENELPEIPVVLGNKETLALEYAKVPSIVTEKNKISSIDIEYTLPDEVKASVSEGQKIGVAKFISDENNLAEIPIVASVSINKLTIYQMFLRIISEMLLR